MSGAIPPLPNTPTLPSPFTGGNIWTYDGGSGGRLEKTDNGELHNFYASPNIIWVMKENVMGETCSAHGRHDICVQNFGRKT
jgi:hypothetical protein